jgi:2-polyprenyl-3-methyl-5-hydroxy-6-metoxy-1,4-benzoquinol methylase
MTSSLQEGVTVRRRVETHPACKPRGASRTCVTSNPRDRAVGMADDVLEHPRLAAIYDALDPNRSDLDVYLRIADELGARRVLDVGRGTGTFALMLADRGLEVTGVDPANASLQVARAASSSVTTAESSTWNAT